MDPKLEPKTPPRNRKQGQKWIRNWNEKVDECTSAGGTEKWFLERNRAKSGAEINNLGGFAQQDLPRDPN